MRFVIDLDSLYLIESTTDRRPVSSVSCKRGDDAPFEVIFVRSGIAEELPATTILTFGAKEEGKFDADPVVLESGFVLVGSGTNAKYTGNPSFNTTELNDLFLIDADDSNDPPHLDLMAEFTWQLPDGVPTTTKTFRFRVHNDVLRNGETTPSVIAAIASLTRTTAQGSPNGFARAYLDLAPTGSTGDNNFDEDDLIEINGTDYTFKATPTLANHVDIGADFDESVTNLLAKIATDAAVTARVVGSANLYAQAAIGGEAGNAITVAATLAAGGEWCEDPDYITPTATLANGDADSVGQYIGHPCRVGDSPGPYAWYAWNGTTWDISAPTGVIENPNNPGFYLRLTVDGDGALAHEPYTLS